MNIWKSLRRRYLAYDRKVLLHSPGLWETRAHTVAPACGLIFGSISLLIITLAPVSEGFVPDCSLVYNLTVAISVILWLSWLISSLPRMANREFQAAFGGWSRVFWWLLCTGAIFSLPFLATWSIHRRIELSFERERILLDYYAKAVQDLALGYFQENPWRSRGGFSDFRASTGTFISTKEAWDNIEAFSRRLTRQDWRILKFNFHSLEPFSPFSFQQAIMQARPAEGVETIRSGLERSEEYKFCAEKLIFLEKLTTSLSNLQTTWTCFPAASPHLPFADLDWEVGTNPLSFNFGPFFIPGHIDSRGKSILFSFGLGEADLEGGHSIPPQIVAPLLIVLVGFQGFFSLNWRGILLVAALALWLGLLYALSELSPYRFQNSPEATILGASLFFVLPLVGSATLWLKTKSSWSTFALTVLFLNVALALALLASRELEGIFYPAELSSLGAVTLAYLVLSPFLQWLLNHHHALPER